MRKAYVIGVGMTKFMKPGRSNEDYPILAKKALTSALEDCKITLKEIQQAFVGYVYGDSTCGQRAVYEVGMTGMPIYNVNNNCATGSTAVYLAKEAIESGKSDCVLALGFDRMEGGSFGLKFLDRTSPLDRHENILKETVGLDKAVSLPIQLFNHAGIEHMKKYGTKLEHFAKVAYKNHKHSVNNPNAQFQDEYELPQILDSPTMFGMLTKLQCCPTSDGAAGAVLASEKFVKAHNLENQAVEIVGMEMVTDFPDSFDKSFINLVGCDMTKKAAERLFKKTNHKPTDVQVVELHDCFSVNELLTYEALGLCEQGQAGEMIDKGDNTYGGKYVVNPSGGLISKGHPLGATGVAQCAELCWQLRGKAGKRQVERATLALQHNVGLGGTVILGLYKLGFPASHQKQVEQL